MVDEHKCHNIDDNEIAWLFEEEASRGGGCRYTKDNGMEIHYIYKPWEAECLDTLDYLSHLQEDSQEDSD